MTGRACKGCSSTTRDLRFPGPRCFSCHRDWKKAVAARQHARHVENIYGLTAGQYAALHAAQGGRCAICQRATGKTKRLAVDHDHQTGEIRGLLCGPCNRELIGRHPAAALERALAYLDRPPARAVIGTVHVPRRPT